MRTPSWRPARAGGISRQVPRARTAARKPRGNHRRFSRQGAALLHRPHRYGAAGRGAVAHGSVRRRNRWRQTLWPRHQRHERRGRGVCHRGAEPRAQARTLAGPGAGHHGRRGNRLRRRIPSDPEKRRAGPRRCGRGGRTLIELSFCRPSGCVLVECAHARRDRAWLHARERRQRRLQGRARGRSSWRSSGSPIRRIP